MFPSSFTDKVNSRMRLFISGDAGASIAASFEESRLRSLLEVAQHIIGYVFELLLPWAYPELVANELGEGLQLFFLALRHRSITEL